MGIVHAKANENITEASEFSPKNVHREVPEKEDIKEINIVGVTARVDKINIDGLSRTKDDILEDCIKELFKAKDFQDVLLKAHKARMKLGELGCFKNISIFIDTSKGPKASPDGLEVTFNVKEFRRLTGGVSTHVGNNEGAFLFGLRAPNLLGRGERVQFEFCLGSQKTSNFNVAFIKPFRGLHRATLSTSLFQGQSEWPTSGYTLVENRLLLDLGFYSTRFLKHNLQWEGTIRDIDALTKTTSFDVRKECGINLKSSFKHTLSVDVRDDPIFPNEGSLFQMTSEVAGAGGNIGFLKNDFFLQTNYSFGEDFVVQACLNGGYLSPLSKDKKINIVDRYFLGGPLSIRGFEMRGIGPRSNGDALGATSFWSGGLHFYTPVPFRGNKGSIGDLFRVHYFINVGNIGNLKFDKDTALVDFLRTDLKFSYGVGLAMRFGSNARVEINYCHPFTNNRNDQRHPGVQFGIGVQFL